MLGKGCIRNVMRKFFQAVAIMGLVVGVLIFYLFSRPSWELSASNSNDGVVVEIYLTGQSIPTYTTLLRDRRVTSEVSRVNRVDLPLNIGSTIFHDETLRPGRWTVKIAGEKLDIMPRALVLKDGTEIMPSRESDGS